MGGLIHQSSNYLMSYQGLRSMDYLPAVAIEASGIKCHLPEAARMLTNQSALASVGDHVPH